MTTNTRNARPQSAGPRPIRFWKLEPDSKFSIFAEPSRGIRKSTDKTVYYKDCEAYSTDTTNPERCIILDREDLVIPLSRPTNRGA